MKKFNFMALAALAACSLCACNTAGGGGDVGDRTLIHFIGVQDSFSQQAMNDLIKIYNEGQGAEDNVYVNATLNSGDYGQYGSILAKKSRYSVVTVELAQFKQLAVKDYFVELDNDTFLSDEAKTQMDYDSIPQILTNPFRMNGSTKNAAIGNKYEGGAGTSLLGIPYAVDPFVLYYNSDIFKKANINIISVPEEKLEAYNATNGTSIKPHGYAEYKNSPFTGAVSSTNLEGKTVFKVFNNAIAMNWEETRILSYMFQALHGYNYGYMSEWWFHYGFSVGGDCIGWDETTNTYKFTITNKDSNYLAIEDVTIGRNSYKKGNVLYYEDAKRVNNNEVDAATKGKLYPLPSQYEAFKEANRLGVPRNKNIEPNIKGYGVSPSVTTNRNERFLTGKDCPMLVENYSVANSFNSSLRGRFDAAIYPQYREFVGGSVHGDLNDITKQYLKVIGETYSGEVYTGDLKTASNGTPIVGEAQSSGSSYGLCIPKNSDATKYEAAMKFITWVCSKEGQTQICKSNSYVPSNSELAFSNEFLNSEDRLLSNTYAASKCGSNQCIGDYSYFQTKTWIDPWAHYLNVDVRSGDRTLTEFEENKLADANAALAQMNLRIYGR